jgi:hypothetical protein
MLKRYGEKGSDPVVMVLGIAWELVTEIRELRWPVGIG